MRSASASAVSCGSSPSPRSSSTVTSPEVKTFARGMIRVGRFLSQTQTSSRSSWKNGSPPAVLGAACCTSSLLQRYVASCVSTQKRKSAKTAWYSLFSASSSSASYSSRSSRWDMTGSVYPSKQGFHVPPPRHDEARSKLVERLEDEAPLVEKRVRDGEPGLVDHLVAVEEEVEVERPRAVLAGDPDAAEALLDGEQAVEELARGQRRLELEGAVEEGRLSADADRLRLAEGRDGKDVDSLLRGEDADGRAQRALAVAEVRAEPDVGARHGLVTVTLTVPSSPAGRTSGFRTRTRTRSGEKRRSSSSATAAATLAPSRSSDPVSFRRELFREKPTSTGLPRASRTSSRRTSWRFCATVLPKPMPGSRQTRASGMPCATANASRPSRKDATSAATSSYRGSSCIVRGSPCMCMRQR